MSHTTCIGWCIPKLPKQNSTHLIVLTHFFIHDWHPVKSFWGVTALLLWGMQVSFPTLRSISRLDVFSVCKDFRIEKSGRHAVGLMSNQDRITRQHYVCLKVMLLFIFWHFTWNFSVVHKSASVKELLVTSAVSVVRLDWWRAAAHFWRAYKAFHVL